MDKGDINQIYKADYTNMNKGDNGTEFSLDGGEIILNIYVRLAKLSTDG